MLYILLVVIIVVENGTLFILSRQRRKNKYDGQMIVVEKEDGGKIFSLELNGDPEDLQDKTSISFKVVQSSE